MARGEITLTVRAKDSATRVLAGISGRVRAFGTGLNKMLGGLGVPLGIGAIVGGFKAIIGKMGDIADTADDLGVTTDQLQSMQYAALTGRAKFDDLAKAITKVSAAQQEAGKNKELQTALAAIGVNAEQFASLGTADAMALLANRMRDSGDEGA